MHVQDKAQMLPMSPGTHTQSTRGFSKRDGTGASGIGWRMWPQAPCRLWIGKLG